MGDTLGQQYAGLFLDGPTSLLADNMPWTGTTVDSCEECALIWKLLALGSNVDTILIYPVLEQEL